MASAWVRRVELASGSVRYRVVWRAGGREAARRYGGSFPTMREARARRDAIAGELAGRRMPDLRSLEMTAPRSPTLAEAAERWRASRVDVADSTGLLHRVALGRVLPILGTRRADEIAADVVADLVAALVGKGYKRETISKSITALAQVLDFVGVSPNPARDKVHVRLPREERAEINPPTAAHVVAVTGFCRRATGCRCSCSTRPGCGSASSSSFVGRRRRAARPLACLRGRCQTRRARWVRCHRCSSRPSRSLCRATTAPPRCVFQGSAATASAPRSRARAPRPGSAFSPHDLRHRRICLVHLAGCRGRGSASTSGSATSPSPRTRTAMCSSPKTRARLPGGARVSLTPYARQPWPRGQYKRYRSRQGCARNAWNLAVDHPDELRLVKGYALESGGLCLGHWWCVDSAGRVVDPTSRTTGSPTSASKSWTSSSTRNASWTEASSSWR